MDIVAIGQAVAQALKKGDGRYPRRGDLASTAAATPALSPYPNFVRTGQTAWTAAQTGLTNSSNGNSVSVYWPKVIDASALSWAPARYLFICSTDHDSTTGTMAYAFGTTPYAPTTSWTKVTAISGLSTDWLSWETPTPVVDTANNRLLVYFQAASTATGRQTTHIMSSANGTTWTWLAEMNQIDVAIQGDNHGGYASSPFPYGDGWGLYSLAGGTNSAFMIMRISRDLVNWWPVRRQLAASDPAAIIEWHRVQFFTWRGETWASFPTTPPVSGAGAVAVYTTTVAKVNPDMRTLRSRPVVTLTGAGASTDNAIESVVPYNDKLVAFYRDGGQTGSIKIAEAAA